MPKIRFLICVFTFFLALCLFGMGVVNADDFTGNWQGSWTSNFGGGGSTSASITQSGTNLTGTLSVTNTVCGDFNNLSLTGSVSGGMASFSASATCGIDSSNNVLNYTNGVLSLNTVIGIYTVYSNGAFYDSGTFALARSTNTITASAGSGGTISPSGLVSVAAGGGRTFTIIPTTGYGILDVKVDGISVGPVPSHTFTNLQANHTIVATFAALAPVANFTADSTSGNIPLTINFTDQSAGSITSRSWNFGDGATSTVQDPSHTYRSAGTHTVSLTVNGPGGGRYRD